VISGQHRCRSRRPWWLSLQHQSVPVPLRPLSMLATVTGRMWVMTDTWLIGPVAVSDADDVEIHTSPMWTTTTTRATMFYVTGFDELFEPRRCQVSWFTTQSVCERRGLDAASTCGERTSLIKLSSLKPFIFCYSSSVYRHVLMNSETKVLEGSKSIFFERQS